MYQNFTKYQEAKQYFRRLSNHTNEGISKEAKITLELYEQFKEEHGDFIAAYFILQTYLEINQIQETQRQLRGIN